MDFATRFDQGLPYEGFLEKYANPLQRQRWNAVFDEVRLTSQQKELLGSFRREMKVLVIAGTWCGDCVEQCPIFTHFARTNDNIRIHYFDRDDNLDLAEALSICGGHRVPSVLFLSEDGNVCGRYGDRTLSKYREIASEEFGGTCPTGIAPPDRTLLQSVVEDWLNEFERIQLVLRTSRRLRKRHND